MYQSRIPLTLTAVFSTGNDDDTIAGTPNSRSSQDLALWPEISLGSWQSTAYIVIRTGTQIFRYMSCPKRRYESTAMHLRSVTLLSYIKIIVTDKLYQVLIHGHTARTTDALFAVKQWIEVV